MFDTTLNYVMYIIRYVHPTSGELYEDNTKMLMQNLGAQAPIMEEEEEEVPAAKPDRNETDEEKKRRLEGGSARRHL